MVMATTVLRGEGATLCEKVKWRAGEHQGEVGELTVAILIEEGHWVALSTGEVIGAGEEAHWHDDGGLGLARRRSSQRQWIWWRSFALALGAWFKWGGEGQGMEPAGFTRERGGFRARASERRRAGRWLVKTCGEAMAHC